MIKETVVQDWIEKQKFLRRVRIEFTTSDRSTDFLDYETDALPTALPRQLVFRPVILYYQANLTDLYKIVNEVLILYIHIQNWINK